MTAIPAAAVAALAAGLDDYRRTTPVEQQNPRAAAERAAEYLAGSGWAVHIPTRTGTRVPCPVCGTTQLINSTGVIRRHGAPGNACRGSAAPAPAA